MMHKLENYNQENSIIITPENVKELGENIAVYALKHLMAYKNDELADLYYDLIRDIHCIDNYRRNITEGYDIAQTAICFLCEYMGKKLDDKVIGKYKRPLMVILACTSEIGNYIYRRRKYRTNTHTLLNTDIAHSEEPFEENNTEQGYDRTETIIKAMNLTKKQAQTLECYMQGMGICETSRFLNVVTSTVWRSRMLLQRKYNELQL